MSLGFSHTSQRKVMTFSHAPNTLYFYIAYNSCISIFVLFSFLFEFFLCNATSLTYFFNCYCIGGQLQLPVVIVMVHQQNITVHIASMLSPSPSYFYWWTDLYICRPFSLVVWKVTLPSMAISLRWASCFLTFVDFG